MLMWAALIRPSGLLKKKPKEKERPRSWGCGDKAWDAGRFGDGWAEGDKCGHHTLYTCMKFSKNEWKDHLLLQLLPCPASFASGNLGTCCQFKRTSRWFAAGAWHLWYLSQKRFCKLSSSSSSSEVLPTQRDLSRGLLHMRWVPWHPLRPPLQRILRVWCLSTFPLVTMMGHSFMP